MDDDEWGDLFAKAAGAACATETQETLPPEKSEKQRKKRKTKRKRTSTDDEPALAFQQMLDQRWRLEPDKARDDSNFLHSQEWHLVTYGVLISIRETAFEIAIHSQQESTNETKKAIKHALRQLQTMIFPSYLGIGEVQLLQVKRDQVLRFYKASSNKKFENCVRLIIACDDLYMRMYYLQVSGLMGRNIASSDLFLPHPISYFSGGAASDSILQTKHDALLTKCRDYSCVAQLFGLNDNEEGQHHILAKLHQIRFLESHVLLDEYHKSVLGVKAWRSVLSASSINSPSMDTHETVAAPLISEWRNSCRDILCNLYAYATLRPCTITTLLQKLRQYKVKRIVELGAGTGYMANLLATNYDDEGRRISVEAFDIAPSDAQVNDYHGRTLPFGTVQQGTYQSVFSRTSDDTALLLCYPPPADGSSSMARDALKAFLSDSTNRILIHIGEYKGLTGCSEFEKLLVSNFDCFWRIPCLTWGTDASSTSIWIRKKTESINMKGKKDDDGSNIADGSSMPSCLLLPCCTCKRRESWRQCRLLRHAVYCSKDCFQANREEFLIACQLSLIPSVIAKKLDYDNTESHFVELPPTK